MKKYQPILLSLLSGSLFVAAWPVSNFTICIFLAFVPLFLIHHYSSKLLAAMGYTFLAILIWNVGTTWWIWNSTDVGSIAAMIANSLLMCLPWWGYATAKKKFSTALATLFFSCFWMLFEWIHLNWDLSWPWLTLGNVFALQTSWIQWYEFTGVAGGTIWILLVNVTIFICWQKKQKLWGILAFAALIIPVLLSYLIINKYENSIAVNKEQQVVIVQPNIDPYEKFSSNSSYSQVALLCSLTKKAIDSTTQLVVWPETAMSANEEQSLTFMHPAYMPIVSLLQQYPQLNLLSGIEMYKNWGSEKKHPAARWSGNGFYYSSINGAVLVNNQLQPTYYYKSKLVPGVEHLPNFLQFLAPVFEQFGGSTGGYTKDTTARVLHLKQSAACAPVICYESIYGNYVREYVSKKANLLTIITNDGWWGNTPGHKQHLQYAKLRAIENRRYVVRSANTGISAVINDKGEIIQTLGWNLQGTIKATVPLLQKPTFYTQYGDFLYLIFGFIGLAMVLLVISSSKLKMENS
ncbi:MAG: apolipoprotein N-acyltransferase [Chitinophagaceae bacterium]